MTRRMKFTWIGGPSFLLETGAFRILGDPVFSDSVESPQAVRNGERPDVDVQSVDVVCLSCLRGDHFDPALGQHISPTAPVITQPRTADRIRGAGLHDVRELGWHHEIRMEKGGEVLTVRAVPARSGSGDDNGYYFRHEVGGTHYTAYCTGDAIWSEEVRQIQQELGYVNLLIQFLGAEGGRGQLTSPDAKEAMQFVYRMQPNAIVAVHHSTFSHYTESITPFMENVGRTIYDKRLHLLREGDSLEK